MSRIQVTCLGFPRSFLVVNGRDVCLRMTSNLIKHAPKRRAALKTLQILPSAPSLFSHRPRSSHSTCGRRDEVCEGFSEGGFRVSILLITLSPCRVRARRR
jgi:hypothetical protein